MFDIGSVSIVNSASARISWSEMVASSSAKSYSCSGEGDTAWAYESVCSCCWDSKVCDGTDGVSLSRERVVEDTLRQWPLRDGRQLVQGRPALEHEHPIQRPLPLQRQQTGIFALVNDSSEAR